MSSSVIIRNITPQSVSASNTPSQGILISNTLYQGISILNTPSQGVLMSNTLPQKIKLNNTSGIIPRETYDGDYDIIPEFAKQVLDCGQKVMREDVVIEPIAVHRISNPQGGKTVYIGGNLDG